MDVVLKYWTWFKKFGPQKTLLPTWCPKLVTGLLCPDEPHFHLCGPAYMPSCTRPEVRLPLDQRVSYGDFCKKCSMSSPGSLLLFCTA